MDKHWEEVMKLAQKYGFLVHAYGGVAVLATHQEQERKKTDKDGRRTDA